MPKSILMTLAAAAWLMQAPALAQAPATSLCKPHEQVIFACRVKSNKLVSLCAHNLGRAQASLQYRFGRPGQIELQHPQQIAGSLQAFRHGSYSRYRVQHHTVGFERRGVHYTVYDYDDGDVTPGTPESHERGVEVSQDGQELATLRCTGRVRSELHLLQDLLPCDTDRSMDCPVKP